MTAPPPGRPTIVIPCFNEALRLAPAGVRRLATDANVLLVDSGSTDRTGELIAGIAASTEYVRTLTLPHNGGKGEAVRRGLLAALDDGADLVGYFDADFATPADEMLRLLRRLDGSPELSVVLASRVALLGRTIDRSPARHYLGRVYATGASLALGLPVYDTQCGAKALRRSPALEAALARPFTTRWAFDVELLGRLLFEAPPLEVSQIVEEPLREWTDVAGTRMIPWEMVRALTEIVGVWWRLRDARRI